MPGTQQIRTEPSTSEAPLSVQRAVRLLWVLFIAVVASMLALHSSSALKTRPGLLLALLVGAFALWLFQAHFISRGNEYGRWTFVWLAAYGLVSFVAALVKGWPLGTLNTAIATVCVGLSGAILYLLFTPASNAWFKERRRALRLRLELLSAARAPIGALRPPALAELPAGVSIREYRPADREACIAVYRENERNGIPQKYLAEFERFLDSGDYLRLVLTREGTVVGIGGIGYEPTAPQPRAWLVFGMIAPADQRRGLGKALLVARLGALQEPDPPVVLVMSNVGGSRKYYKQYGFSFVAKLPSARGDEWFAHSAARLDSRAWRRCRELAAALGLDVSTLRVPAPDPPQGRPSSAQPERHEGLA
jgi:predicted N-acetyltransferase YhbS